MVDSILEDIKRTFRSGNMVSKIILVNVAAFIALGLIFVLDFQASTDPNSFHNTVKDFLSLPSAPGHFIKQPWTIITHMFMHNGFWHLLMNMLMFYWFGTIVGDLIGDEKILPLYILSGFFGGLVFMIHDLYLPGGTGGSALALGASAAVMANIWTAAMISPDYVMRLLFLGPVRIKYIAIGLLFFDLMGSAGDMNKGGHFAHLGGAIFGMVYVYLLRQGTDIVEPFSNFGHRPKKNRKQKIEKTPRNKFKVVHSQSKRDKEKNQQSGFNQQEELDRILDKINTKGYENLTAEEKDFLYKASKKK